MHKRLDAGLCDMSLRHTYSRELFASRKREVFC